MTPRYPETPAQSFHDFTTQHARTRDTLPLGSPYCLLNPNPRTTQGMADAHAISAAETEPSPLDLLILSFGLHRRLETLVEKTSREFDLTATEALALHCLSRRPEFVSEVARQTGLRPNGASVLIGRLVSKRLVRRQRSRGDRRLTLITLTDSGQALAATLQLNLWRDIESFLEPLPPAARTRLSDLLRLLA